MTTAYVEKPISRVEERAKVFRVQVHKPHVVRPGIQADFLNLNG